MTEPPAADVKRIAVEGLADWIKENPELNTDTICPPKKAAAW